MKNILLVLLGTLLGISISSKWRAANGNSAIYKLWVYLTYWKVKCADCHGTGICHGTQAGQPSSRPHSCCGDCGNKYVPRSKVPDNFEPKTGDMVLIGTGIMYRRPWSRTQVQKPF